MSIKNTTDNCFSNTKWDLLFFFILQIVWRFINSMIKKYKTYFYKLTNQQGILHESY